MLLFVALIWKPIASAFYRRERFRDRIIHRSKLLGAQFQTAIDLVINTNTLGYTDIPPKTICNYDDDDDDDDDDDIFPRQAGTAKTTSMERVIPAILR